MQQMTWHFGAVIICMIPLSNKTSSYDEILHIFHHFDLNYNQKERGHYAKCLWS